MGATPRYYTALDGLRGYAASLVVLLHLMGAVLTEYFRLPESRISATSDVPGIAVMAFLAEGHHGVEIFFVLSGFLMARLAQSGRGWGDFFLRRARRIYPAFVVSLACAAALYCLAYGWEFDAGDFVLNLVFANAWPGSGVTGYNHVSWTLGYEFAFYLTLPLLMASRSVTVRMALGMLACGALLAFGPPPVSRMASLFAGFVLGCVADSTIARHVRRVPMVVVLSLYCAIVFAKAAGWIGARVFFGLLPVLVTLVVARIAFDPGRVGRAFSSRPMAALGRLSYSIYLWHPMVIAVVVYDLLPRSGLSAKPGGAVTFIVVACVLLTLGISAASYRWIEAPFLRHRTGGPPRPRPPGPGDSANCRADTLPVKLATPL